MRLKKGFTLAEILIVLIVIGAIATMTIPSLMASIQEARFKTAYKKAYNTIVNLSAMERISGTMPNKGDTTAAISVTKMLDALVNNLSIKDYVLTSANAIGSGNPAGQSDILSGITYTQANGSTFGEEQKNDSKDSNKVTNKVTPDKTASGVWITSEDNISYTIIKKDTNCATKATINSQTSIGGMIDESCAVIVVDVNGVTTGPNYIEPQVGKVKDGAINGNELVAGTKMGTLTGDQYLIFIGNDGATAGPSQYSVMGRIVGDVK